MAASAGTYVPENPFFGSTFWAGRRLWPPLCIDELQMRPLLANTRANAHVAAPTVPTASASTARTGWFSTCRVTLHPLATTAARIVDPRCPLLRPLVHLPLSRHTTLSPPAEPTPPCPARSPPTTPVVRSEEPFAVPFAVMDHLELSKSLIDHPDSLHCRP